MLTALIYAILHGLSAVFPVGTQLHHSLLEILMGQESADPLLLLLLDIAVLLGLVTGCQKYFVRLRRERGSRNRRGIMSRQLASSLTVLSVAYGLILYFTRDWAVSVPLAALLFFLNGILLYVSDRMPQGNKDSRNTTPMDTLAVGLGGALGAFHLSGIGGALCACRWRGMSRQYGLMLSLLLAIGIQAWSILTDIFALATGTFVFGNLLIYILAAVFTFLMTRMSISSLQQLSVKTGYSCFSYYCWGAGLLLFILYLSV